MKVILAQQWLASPQEKREFPENGTVGGVLARHGLTSAFFAMLEYNQQFEIIGETYGYSPCH